MGAHPGKEKTGGRKKGTPNKKVHWLEEKIQELKIDPFEVLIYFAGGKWKELGYKDELIYKHGPNGTVNEEYTIPPNVRAKAAAEACQYLYPKLKAIEHSGTIDSQIEGGISLSIVLPDNGRSKVK